MIDLLIVAPPRGFDQHVPAGFIFADEVFAAAELRDPISVAQEEAAELRRALHYLGRRYPRRIRVRWVDPWTPGGLWLSFRFRLRAYPAVIVNQSEVLKGEQLQFQTFCDLISQLLAAIDRPDSPTREES